MVTAVTSAWWPKSEESSTDTFLFRFHRLSCNVLYSYFFFCPGPGARPGVTRCFCLLGLPKWNSASLRLSWSEPFWGVLVCYFTALGLSCSNIVAVCSIFSGSLWYLVLWPGIEPGPPAFGRGVLATGPPGKAPWAVILEEILPPGLLSCHLMISERCCVNCALLGERCPEHRVPSLEGWLHPLS